MAEHGTVETKIIDGTLADFDRAIEIVPDFASAHYDRGMLLKARKEYGRATEDFLNVIRYGGDLTLNGQACYNLGELKKLQGDQKQSASYFAQAFFYRGTVEAARDENSQALADFDKSIEFDSSSAQTFYNRGLLKEKLQDLAGASHDFDKAIVLNPKYSEAYNNRGAMKARSGDLEGALADFHRAIELNTNSVSAYVNRAIARKQNGDVAGSMADQNQAIRLSSGRRNAP
jgi:tetratricopeptide (TPR) repeat protein